MSNASIVGSVGKIPAIILGLEGAYEGNLRHYIKVVVDKARNLYKPYHNFRHMFYVAYSCHEACLYYKPQERKLDGRSLLIAAMFHDFDHTGMTGDDDLNIQYALRGLKKHILPEDQGRYNKIADLIWATQFPYTSTSDSLSLEGQILRDADSSQSLNLDWIQQVPFGLGRETGLGFRKMLEMQEPFLSNLTFSTEWARTRFPPEVIQGKIQESRALLELLS